MLLPDMGVLPDGFRSPICTDGGFAMKLLNVAQVVEVVKTHGCGDWGDVDVGMIAQGLRVAIGRDVFVLPVVDGMAEVASTSTQAILLAWADDMGF